MTSISVETIRPTAGRGVEERECVVFQVLKSQRDHDSVVFPFAEFQLPAEDCRWQIL